MRDGHATGRLARGGLLLAGLMLFFACMGAQAARAETAQDSVTFSCRTVTYFYTGFPNANGNTVTEIVYVDGSNYLTKSFNFDGPSGEDAVAINLPPGHHKIDARAKWKTNGVKGGHDQPHKGGLNCVPESSFTVEKLQQASHGTSFTTGTIFGAKRQTVSYEILVRNTGNVGLVLSGFSDVRCDAGTIEGGPGAEAVAPGDSTLYTCKHRLTPEDQALGLYENVASVTGTPPPGDGPPVTQPSNPVLVELPHDVVDFSCSSVTLTFANFPNAPGNTVSELVYVDGQLLISTSFSFEGPDGSNTLTLTLPAGHHSIDVRARWKTNGVSGGHDQHLEGGLRCEGGPES